MKNLSIMVLVTISFLFLSCEERQNPKWLKFTYLKSVTDLAIDENFLWAVSEKGLLKINIKSGESLLLNDSTLGISIRHIGGIVVDKERNLWINAVFSLIKLSKDKTTQYDSSNSCIPEEHISESMRMFVKGKEVPVWCSTTINEMIAEKDGTIWVTTSGSELIKIFDGNCEIINKYNSNYPSGSITSICSDKSEVKWLGMSKERIAKFTGNSFEVFSIPNKFELYTSIDHISLDSKKNVWVVANLYGGCLEPDESYLFKFNGKDWESLSIDGSKGNFEGRIFSFTIDKNDDLWLSTSVNGLLKFDGENWISFNSKNSGLLNNKVNTIVVDKYNNKWIGTDLGISVFNENGVDLEKININ